jgi:hypothetical protein
MVIWYNLYYNGTFVKQFGASNQADANKECRLFEQDYKLTKYSIKAIERV